MTKDDYKLFTGAAATYSDEDWERLTSVAEGRLASFLCLETFPEDPQDDLIELLANFLYEVLAHQGDDTPVEEKRVRNFTIRFSTSSAMNAFAKLKRNYSDVIAKYSKCGSGICYEKSVCERCYNGDYL